MPSGRRATACPRATDGSPATARCERQNPAVPRSVRTCEPRIDPQEGGTTRFSANDRRNRIVVRLACCCGLRVSEIASLQLDDVVIEVQRPHLRLRREITKGRRARCVPLWWDAGTLADLQTWKGERLEQGARGTDPFVVRCNRIDIGGRCKELRSVEGSSRPAKCWVWRGFGPWRFTTGGTRSSATRSQAGGHWPRCVQRPGMQAF